MVMLQARRSDRHTAWNTGCWRMWDVVEPKTGLEGKPKQAPHFRPCPLVRGYNAPRSVRGPVRGPVRGLVRDGPVRTGLPRTCRRT